MPRGAGAGRPPNPSGQVRHRHPPARGVILLQADARVATIPEPSFPLTGVRHDVWQEMWSQPIATLWNRVDLAALTRLVILQTTLDALSNHRLLAEMRQLEDRFLLNPYARAQQRVVIDDGTFAVDTGGNVAWLADAHKRLRP